MKVIHFTEGVVEHFEFSQDFLMKFILLLQGIHETYVTCLHFFPASVVEVLAVSCESGATWIDGAHLIRDSRKAAADSERKTGSKSLAASRLGLPARESYGAPQGMIEETLPDIWCSLLKLQRVSRHSDFFELGGDSLHGMRLMTQITERLGTRLPEAIEARSLEPRAQT